MIMILIVIMFLSAGSSPFGCRRKDISAGTNGQPRWLMNSRPARRVVNRMTDRSTTTVG